MLEMAVLNDLIEQANSWGIKLSETVLSNSDEKGLGIFAEENLDVRDLNLPVLSSLYVNYSTRELD